MRTILTQPKLRKLILLVKQIERLKVHICETLNYQKQSNMQAVNGLSPTSQGAQNLFYSIVSAHTSLLTKKHEAHITS